MPDFATGPGSHAAFRGPVVGAYAEGDATITGQGKP